MGANKNCFIYHQGMLEIAQHKVINALVSSLSGGPSNIY